MKGRAVSRWGLARTMPCPGPTPDPDLLLTGANSGGAGDMKRYLAVLLTAILLSGCGGGGGGSSQRPPETMPTIKVPMDSITRAKPDARDPLPSFRALSVPTSSRFDYRREVPSGGMALKINQYTAPGTDMPADLIPMMHRAAKVWTMRVEGVRSPRQKTSGQSARRARN